MAHVSTWYPAIKEIKNCEKAMNKIGYKGPRNKTEEQYFEERKQMWLYRKEMRLQAERLIKEINEAEQGEREFYARYTCYSLHERMLRDFILNEQ